MQAPLRLISEARAFLPSDGLFQSAEARHSTRTECSGPKAQEEILRLVATPTWELQTSVQGCFWNVRASLGVGGGGRDKRRLGEGKRIRSSRRIPPLYRKKTEKRWDLP